jgi:hypothetical protein
MTAGMNALREKYGEKAEKRIKTEINQIFN